MKPLAAFHHRAPAFVARSLVSSCMHVKEADPNFEFNPVCIKEY